MTITIFLLALGATARLTRLLTQDYILRNFRAFFIRHFGPDSDIGYGIGCAWCCGFWISAAVLPVAWFFGNELWFQLPAAALSASYIIGIANGILDGPDGDE